MIGTIRINLIVAALAGLFTFALSIANNLLLTTCLKSLYSFVILFVLTFGFRWVLGVMTGFDHREGKQSLDNYEVNDAVGQTLDMTTPDDEDAATREMLKANLDPNHSKHAAETQFSPLNPPKLVTKNNLDPEQLAGALRRMSED
ncbi:hypothetical protein GK047_05995 [Paenibacillus sp. SYP-B3998]|uniref:Uncharacterized protein n=1 Tax=Paenibacillus sp. SYP-B3998 TaxID=2678564 RepID=A0A6G3ZU29_9BACL|nr:hypothetical protein [Paenibacillus sp. SYP-B3998]NEW05570.1 hypothetical protein [Paenibacillus sp. SYP-B3998]